MSPDGLIQRTGQSLYTAIYLQAKKKKRKKKKNNKGKKTTT